MLHIKFKKIIGHAVTWLFARLCKKPGSIPDEVIGFFNLPNPSSRTKLPGYTQPITQINTRDVLLWKMQPTGE
jgi:hypothetical protein